MCKPAADEVRMHTRHLVCLAQHGSADTPPWQQDAHTRLVATQHVALRYPNREPLGRVCRWQGLRTASAPDRRQ
jgi:hypothetical protein